MLGTPPNTGNVKKAAVPEAALLINSLLLAMFSIS
jgi:hypothetical protein